MTIPGGGLVTALSFMTAIDNPLRFRRLCHVRSTSAGDADVRRALYNRTTAVETWHDHKTADRARLPVTIPPQSDGKLHRDGSGATIYSKNTASQRVRGASEIQACERKCVRENRRTEKRRWMQSLADKRDHVIGLNTHTLPRRKNSRAHEMMERKRPPRWLGRDGD